MDPLTMAIGVGANLVGSVLGSNSAKKQNAAAMAHQHRMLWATGYQQEFRQRRQMKFEDQYKRKQQHRDEWYQKRAENRQRAAEIAAEDRAYARTDPAAIRKRAEEAGFNPLASPETPLGIGGTSGFGFASGATGFSGAASISPVGAPQTSIGDLVARGFAGASDAVFQAEQLAIQQSQLELERQRINTLAQQMALTPEVGGIYAQQRANRSVSAGSSGASPAAGAAAASLPVQEAASEVVEVAGNQGYISANPKAGERGEAAYGEIGGEVLGLANAVDDLRGNTFQHAFDPEWGWEFRWPERPDARPSSSNYTPSKPKTAPRNSMLFSPSLLNLNSQGLPQDFLQ
ncbi:hypothetical protein ACFE33_15855 (plasmid) [Falsihalocynthiibacter sp. SS001]|uniref:hypothetical protein n=1 Tax=Falsihalocynthiibacter sp. SS001 TaxID=3349698 RepID=UPI0036D306E8